MRLAHALKGLLVGGIVAAVSSVAVAQGAPDPAPQPYYAPAPAPAEAPPTVAPQPTYAPAPPPPGYVPAPQPYYQPEGFRRSGLVVGFGVGGGQMKVETDGGGTADGGAVAIDFHIGGMLTRKLALMYSAFVMAHPEDNGTVTHGFNGITAQYWPGSRLWVKGGIGIARMTLTFDNGYELSKNGGGAELGVGYELMQGKSMAMDVQLRTSVGAFENDYNDKKLTIVNSGILLGFNWY